jgi:hypothetical protein
MEARQSELFKSAKVSAESLSERLFAGFLRFEGLGWMIPFFEPPMQYQDTRLDPRLLASP